MTHKTIRPPVTPYQPGDHISVMDDAGVATLKVERCVALSSRGRWQVTARRPDGGLFDVAVDADGRDHAGRVSRPTNPAGAHR